MVEIVNRQRKIRIGSGGFLQFAENAGKIVPGAENRDFTVAFVSDRKMRELNSLFRGKRSTTDVLSFPSGGEDSENGFDLFEENHLGDIVISAERAREQAAENGLNLETEIKQLILHGLLHLCGFDHETDGGEMNALELGLRDKLKIN